MTLTLNSPAFQPEGSIPREYTCEGDDLSPALEWSGAPAGTTSFALIVDDPDAPDPKAPKMTWVHWVLYDIPASVNGLPRGMKSLPPGTREGVNDWKRTGYGGPCPPSDGIATSTSCLRWTRRWVTWAIHARRISSAR